MNYPFISIVVGVKNDQDYISECINSLLKLDYPNDLYEIIIIDGMSIDNTQNIIKQYPVKLISCPKNIAGARNLGVKHAKGDYIAFTDSDCKVDTIWLKTLVQEIINAPKNVVCVGGPNLVFDKDPIIGKVIGYSQETLIGSGGSAQSYKYSEKCLVQSIPNCNALYRKDAIEKIEYYDESLFIGEDGDLNYRLKQAGYEFLYIPDAKVWHHRRARLKTFSMRMYNYGKWMAKISKKHNKILRWYSILPGVCIIYAVFALIISIKYLFFIQSLSLLVFTYFILLSFTTFKVVCAMKSLSGLYSYITLPLQHIMYGFGFLDGYFNITEIK